MADVLDKCCHILILTPNKGKGINSFHSTLTDLLKLYVGKTCDNDHRINTIDCGSGVNINIHIDKSATPTSWFYCRQSDYGVNLPILYQDNSGTSNKVTCYSQFFTLPFEGDIEKHLNKYPIKYSGVVG